MILSIGDVVKIEGRNDKFVIFFGPTYDDSVGGNYYGGYPLFDDGIDKSKWEALPIYLKFDIISKGYPL